MTEDAQKTFKKHFFYSKENVIMPTGNETRDYNITATDNRTDTYLTQRIKNISTQIGDYHMYRIPLRFLFDVGEVNQPIKINLKVICNLKKTVDKLFELNKVATLPIRRLD